MLGTTLEEIRSHIESLASEDGTYFLVCARYGDRPVPTAGLRFETRARARAAARGTEQYRAALRRYDPRLPQYDVIVCQEAGRVTPGAPGTSGDPAESAGRTAPGATSEQDDWSGNEPRSEWASVDPEHGWSHVYEARVEFCHRVAGAVFEALSEAGHDAVESAVMDAYFELAERVTDLDDLCLCLLESMAAELDRRLSVDEQATVIDSAVSRLPSPDSTGHPVAATLGSLERQGLVGEYTWSPAAENDNPERLDIVVRLSEYALSRREDRLPVLPVVVELVRNLWAKPVASVRVSDAGEGWRVRLGLGGDATPNQLVSARIDPEG